MNVFLFILCLLAIYDPAYAMDLSLSSPAFSAGSVIPQQYSCEDANRSPPLTWQYDNPKTQSYLLIVDDPDAPAGDWIHWILFNIPPNTNSLTAGTYPPEALNGQNSWGSIGYRGPCPPSGTHHYYFRLYALDTVINLPAGASIDEIKEAMQNHVLATSEIMATYSH